MEFNKQSEKSKDWKILDDFAIGIDKTNLVWGGEKIWDFTNLLPNSRKIKLFVRCESGGSEHDVVGSLILRTANDVAYFAYHSYDQAAWSFNSENIVLKLDDTKVLRVSTTSKMPAGNFGLSIKVIAHK